MAAPHETVLYDVHDAKVYTMTSDSGASPAFGAAIDVPGIAQVGLDPNFVTAELKGDARVIARKGRVDRMNLTATYGKLSLDVLNVILEGTLADTGSGASEVATFSQLGDNSLAYFKFAFKIDDVESGLSTVHITLYKCQLTGGTLVTGQTDQFGQPTLELQAIPAASDDKMWKVEFFEAVTALPA